MKDVMNGETLDRVHEATEEAPLAVRHNQEIEPPRQRPVAMAAPQPHRAPADVRIRQSADADQVMMAFARAHMDFPVIAKTKTAHIENGRAKYSYKYADLADVHGQIKPILKREKLAFMTIPTGGKLVGRLVHEPSGQWIEGDLSIVPPDTRGGVQALGSALTYERRYIVATMLDLTLDDDDDGAAAQGLKRVLPPGTLPGELAIFVAQCAADGPGARVELVDMMTNNGETPDVQAAALRMFDALTKAVA